MTAVYLVLDILAGAGVLGWLWAGYLPNGRWNR